jgi:aminopeptidase N
VSYDPATDRLVGLATISATATQNLSRFNLDFVGLTVRSITVNGRPVSWSRTEHELTVTPAHGLRDGRRFTTVVRYDGVPIPQQLVLGPGFTIEAGFIHTDDPFWSVLIGDSGPELLFDNAVYFRGAMAVHALRVAIGDRDSPSDGRPSACAADRSPRACARSIVARR